MMVLFLFGIRWVINIGIGCVSFVSLIVISCGYRCLEIWFKVSFLFRKEVLMMICVRLL